MLRFGLLKCCCIAAIVAAVGAAIGAWFFILAEMHLAAARLQTPSGYTGSGIKPAIGRVRAPIKQKARR
ncbi:hypothetical protein ADM96_13550 [Burkholderia sp. ST111]|nr:hypothetical protein ADM96_13550 [Burkholderia sp. ST111]